MVKDQQCLSESQVRSQAEEQSEFSTSHTQFHRFVRSGLLSEGRVEGRKRVYQPEAVDHLIEAHTLGQGVRSISRRVLRARRRRKIRVEKVREAILCVIREIRSPQGKLRKMAMAVNQVVDQDAGTLERVRGLRKDRWEQIVRDADPVVFDDALGFMYYFLAAMQMSAPDAAATLARDVPALEERVTLLLVLNLAGREQHLNRLDWRSAYQDWIDRQH